jgi:folylpolyglutamate synthase/dihydropteroate synthase
MEVVYDFEGRPLSLSLALYGDFQAENIQNALAVFARLRAAGLIPRIGRRAIGAALARFGVPGRMERVCRRPEMIVDGGHCPTAAAAVARAMAAHFRRRAGRPDRRHDGRKGP